MYVWVLSSLSGGSVWCCAAATSVSNGGTKQMMLEVLNSPGYTTWALRCSTKILEKPTTLVFPVMASKAWCFKP
uniref:Putative secreted protein n=1 Tax=Xenopsylla cheopis TaxID=163159 RepID=A0A6M2DXJ7_XENCH